MTVYEVRWLGKPHAEVPCRTSAKLLLKTNGFM